MQFCARLNLALKPDNITITLIITGQVYIITEGIIHTFNVEVLRATINFDRVPFSVIVKKADTLGWPDDLCILSNNIIILAMDPNNISRKVTEEIVISGGELVEFVKRVVAEGNIRRLIIKKADDEVLLEIPLTTGAVVGGALVIVAPVLAALGALAALLAKVKVVVVREKRDEEESKGYEE